MRNVMARKPFVSRRRGVAWICLCAALLGAGPLRAQLGPAPEAGGGGPATGEQPAPGSQPAKPENVRVKAALSSQPDHRNRAGLGDGLTLTVQNLKPALRQIPKGCEGLILFLNKIAIKGVPPDSCDAETGNVHFTLDRTDESDQAWHVLLEEPIAYCKIISVSVGPEGDLSFPTDVEKFELEVLPKPQLFGYFSGLALFLAVLVRLARRTALLRDPAPPGGNGKLAPYSLSRFQLAFWSFIVVAAYVFIWLITGELDTITGSVLGLLGIGSATALSAKLIDTSKPAAETAEAGTAAASTPEPIPAKHTVSRGFLRDVLSDAGGISLYRLQLFVWTLVLGIIFISSVYHGLQMPQFSTTLLGLMGISSGTYVGFKVPESRAAPST
jgi:hypothetical protein